MNHPGRGTTTEIETEAEGIGKDTVMKGIAPTDVGSLIVTNAVALGLGIARTATGCLLLRPGMSNPRSL